MGHSSGSYHSANNKLMFIPRRWYDPPQPYPHYLSTVRDYADPQVEGPVEPQDGEWNLYRINPYIDAFSKNFNEDGFATAMVACPNCSGDFMVENVYATWEANLDFTELAYSYWVIGPMPDQPVTTGGSPDSSENVFRDLTIDEPSPKRLLMTEILAIDDWGGTSGWPFRYNHGRRGWSWFNPDFIHIQYDPEPEATGRSQLFGDCHVTWRPIPLEYEDNMPNSDDVGPLENEWNGPGSGWMGFGDTSYY